MEDLVAACADILDDAARRWTAAPLLTQARPELTTGDAYRVQDERTRRRAATGDRVVGATIGLASRAAQSQAKDDGPIFGRIFASDLLAADAPLAGERHLAPRVEPTIVFLVGEDLRGPGVSAATVVAATAGVAGGLQVLDGRYASPTPAAADLIADGTGAAGLLLGSRFVDPARLDLRLLGVMLEADGHFAASAAGAAALGHPADAVARLANWLARRGEALLAGSLVCSGGLTPAAPIGPGTAVTATFAHLGSVSLRGA
jgi:2-oxo-3-hexenedioate decarboxylase